MADGYGRGEGFEGTDVPLVNVVLSTNPCPSCKEINGKAMTYAEWEASEWGLPGSSGRYCEDDCHCILVPEPWVEELPPIGEKIKLRGDKETDIRKIVDVGPSEQSLLDLMEEWYALGHRILPREIYDMEFEEIEPYLRRLIAAEKGK